MATEKNMQPAPASISGEPDTQAPAQPYVPTQHQGGKARVGLAAARQTRERLVLLSMALVTAASAASFYGILGYSLAEAVLAGGGVWAVLMTAHLHMKSSAEIARLKAEVHKLEASRNFANADGPPIKDPSSADGESGKQRARFARRGPASRPGPNAGPEGQRLPSAPPGPQPHPRWETTGRNSTGTARPAPAMDGGRISATQSRASDTLQAPAAPPIVETALWPGTALSAADPMRDQWAFRPRESADGQTSNLGSGDEPGLVPPTTSTSIDADLAMVQRKIKALADEVNATEAARERPAPATLTAQGRGPAPAAPVEAAAMLEASIGELKATAQSMRTTPAQAATGEDAHAMPLPQGQALPFELLIPATAERIAVSQPSLSVPSANDPADALPELRMPTLETAPQTAFELPELPSLNIVAQPPPPNPRVVAILNALENGEMDVFLSPIVALQSHKVSHYDVTVRLKAASGGYIDNAEQELQLAGSDVLALFDTARLRRAASLAQRLDAHNKSGSLLSAVNGPSITNAEFLETFARVFEERDRISNQLVLTFTQADLEQFSPSAWQALGDMQAFGFRFALSQIDHVAMDFSALAERGFAFLRLEAGALMHGLPARDRFIEAEELCKYLAGAGMTLVADTIDDEAIRARVFGFGVLFGQGRLFGGARQVKLDQLPKGSSAAA